MSWIKTLRSWFAKTQSDAFVDKLIAGIKAAEPYLAEIYKLVRLVAELTPTRADDEILRAAEALGVPFLLQPGTKQRGTILAEIVLKAARRKFPEAAERVLRRAIEIAYGAIRP